MIVKFILILQKMSKIYLIYLNIGFLIKKLHIVLKLRNIKKPLTKLLTVRIF